MKFEFAPDVHSEIIRIVLKLGMIHISSRFLICFRSYGSKSRAIARIWSLPKIWQLGLNLGPHYCIEVISEKFDKLDKKEKEKVIIHELLHIPNNFSGALLPHRHRARRIDRKTVDKWHSLLINNSK